MRNTALKPKVSANMAARIGAITDAAPFTAQIQGMSRRGAESAGD